MEPNTYKPKTLQTVVAWVMAGLMLVTAILDLVIIPAVVKDGNWELYETLVLWVELVTINGAFVACYALLAFPLAHNVASRVSAIILMSIMLLSIALSLLHGALGLSWGFAQVRYILFGLGKLYAFSIVVNSYRLSRADTAWISMMAVMSMYVLFFYLIGWIGGWGVGDEVFNMNVYIDQSLPWKLFCAVYDLTFAIGLWRMCRSVAFSGNYDHSAEGVRLSPFTRFFWMVLICGALMAFFMLLLFRVLPQVLIGLLF